MTSDPKFERRAFLLGSAGALAASTLEPAVAQTSEPKPLPAYVNWKDPKAFIVHSDQTLEMKRDLFGTSLITPEDRLFIRNNVKPPPESIAADRDAWRVEFAGVKQPKTFTLGELKRLRCDGGNRAAMFRQWSQIFHG